MPVTNGLPQGVNPETVLITSLVQQTVTDRDYINGMVYQRKGTAMSFFVQVIDVGERVNCLLGRRYYRRGEVVRLHVCLDNSHFWLEQSGTWEKAYRIGTGENPTWGEYMPLDDARKALGLFSGGM